MKAKELKERLLKKENDIIRGVQLYCAQHEDAPTFTKETNKILRTALRKFFVEAIYPSIRDLNEVNIKDYHND